MATLRGKRIVIEKLLLHVDSCLDFAGVKHRTIESRWLWHNSLEIKVLGLLKPALGVNLECLYLLLEFRLELFNLGELLRGDRTNEGFPEVIEPVVKHRLLRITTESLCSRFRVLYSDRHRSWQDLTQNIFRRLLPRSLILLLITITNSNNFLFPFIFLLLLVGLLLIGKRLKCLLHELFLVSTTLLHSLPVENSWVVDHFPFQDLLFYQSWISPHMLREMVLVDGYHRASSFGTDDGIVSQASFIWVLTQLELLVPKHVESLMDANLHIFKLITHILVVKTEHILPLSHLFHRHDLREIVFLTVSLSIGVDVFKYILVEDVVHIQTSFAQHRYFLHGQKLSGFDKVQEVARV